MQKILCAVGCSFMALLLVVCAVASPGGESVDTADNPLAAIALSEYESCADVSGGAKYWDYWGKTEEQWCVDFVYYCADQLELVGEDKPMGTYTGGVGECWRNIKAQGGNQFAVGEDLPRAGDLVFWYSSSSAATNINVIPPMLHIGIVLSYSEEDGLVTIEGNSGGGGSANSHIRRNSYPSLLGESWSGAAIFGFARVTESGGTLTDMLISFEGFSAYPKWDYAQYTVGYGTQCPAELLSEYMRHGISRDEARLLLRQAVADAAESVDAFAAEYALSLTRYQRDALTGLTYNIGAGWMRDSGYATFRRTIFSADADALTVAQAFAEICHAGGKILPSLVSRRLCEAQLYLHGDYVSSVALTDFTYVIDGDAVIVSEKTP